TSDVRAAGAMASLIAGLFGAPVSDSKTRPNTVPLREVSHGIIDDDNRIPAAAQSEGEQLIVPLSVVPQALVFPISAPGNTDSGNSKGIPVKSTLAQSRVSGTQEIAG